MSGNMSGNTHNASTPSQPAGVAVTPGSRLYETERAVAEYLEFHYGPTALGVANFPAAAIAEVAGRLRGTDRGLDVGCAVGRASFELARLVGRVDAIDFSASFIDACRRVQSEPVVDYEVVIEGSLTEPRRIDLASLGLAEVRQRVHFAEGDACRLDPSLSGYDVVFAGNLIDRLYDPAAFLEGLGGRLQPGGLLVITSPYTWLADYTPPDRWLGGRVVDGRPRRTLEGIGLCLGDRFDLEARCDLPFVIRETARKHQHTFAEVSCWRKAD